MPDKDKIELIIKVCTALILMLGFFFSILKFQKEQEANRVAEDKRKEEALKMKVWEKQLELYLKVTEISSTLAIEDPNNLEYKKAEKDFWKLYWGNLCLVENKSVIKAMISFGQALEQKQGGLKNLSFNLTQSCREEISERWNVKFENLKQN